MHCSCEEVQLIQCMIGKRIGLRYSACSMSCKYNCRPLSFSVLQVHTRFLMTGRMADNSLLLWQLYVHACVRNESAPESI